MTSKKRQNPLIPILVCACGWLFGQGMYEMMRSVVLNKVESGFNPVTSHHSHMANHEFFQHVYIRRDSGPESKGEKIGSNIDLIEV